MTETGAAPPRVPGARARGGIGDGRFALARLPTPRRILSWIYLGRLILSVAVFVSVLLVWQRADPAVTLAAALILVAAGVVTAGSFWYTHLLGRAPGRNFLYAQSSFDTLLVTWVVHLTGGAESPFTSIYILVICAAAILLPVFGGVLVALLASALYMADVLWNSPGALHGSLLLQIGLFATVALVTGYLGDRLRQTGTALDEVKEQLESLRLDTDEILGTINTGILTVDGEGRLVYMNPAAAELLSLRLDQWAGRPILERLDAIAPGLGWVVGHTQRERQPVNRFETEDVPDAPFVLGVSTTLVDRDNGRSPAVTAIFQNITEKLRLEQLKSRAERLEALAELSASLAHEIKNPLASIRSAVEQIAVPDIDADDKVVLSQLVVRESTRLSRLLSEFIDFSRVKVTQPRVVDLCAVIDQAAALARRHPDAEGRSIEVEVASGAREVMVEGGEDLLHRAVLNLLLNGVQWAGPGGRVALSLRLDHSDLLSPVLGARGIARVTVVDSGPGIDPEVVDDIFNPFFTRRPGGTGLGLALVQRAAEAHGGVVFVDSGSDDRLGGAAFTLCLPAMDATDLNAPEHEAAEVAS